MTASTKTLEFLAMATWVVGGVVLFGKGYSLYAEASGLRPSAAVNFLPFAFAATIGALKARTLFLSACRRNLERIGSLAHPRPWQFFRPGFFVFLFTMITLGAWLSRAASGRYVMLLAVSSLDLTLSVALFGSLVGFKRS